MSDHVESGFFVKIHGWHRKGNLLEKPPETMAEAITAAGLDWEVGQAPVQFSRPLRGAIVPADVELDNIESLATIPATQEIGTITETVDSHFVNYRKTDGRYYGVVSKSYHVYQNREMFSWFEPLVEQKLVTLEAAGSLHNGRKVWVLAKVAHSTVEVVKGDAVENYLLLAHGHDGKFAIRAGFTNVRVVCQNTLDAACNYDADRLFRLRHSAALIVNLEAAREVFDVQRAKLRVRAEIFQKMAKFNMSDNAARNYIRECLVEGAGTNPNIEVRNVDEIMSLFEAGRGAEFSRGTLWGAFNAVTEYLTHVRHRSVDARLESQWFGDSAKLAGRALTICETLLSKG